MLHGVARPYPPAVRAARIRGADGLSLFARTSRRFCNSTRRRVLVVTVVSQVIENWSTRSHGRRRTDIAAANTSEVGVPVCLLGRESASNGILDPVEQRVFWGANPDRGEGTPTARVGGEITPWGSF
jgi:hypothetical protein